MPKYTFMGGWVAWENNYTAKLSSVEMNWIIEEHLHLDYYTNDYWYNTSTCEEAIYQSKAISNSLISCDDSFISHNVGLSVCLMICPLVSPQCFTICIHCTIYSIDVVFATYSCLICIVQKKLSVLLLHNSFQLQELSFAIEP